MLESIRRKLRLKTDALDDEINDLIDAARAELVQAGVTIEKAQSDTDPLIKQAVSFYCQANFGMDNSNAERYARAFESLRDKLSLLREYTAASG